MHTTTNNSFGLCMKEKSLLDIGLVIESGRVRGRFRGMQPMGYKLDLGRSERLQTVAIEIDSLN